MISPATGMRAGECYGVESVERAPHFPGFFLDGKYYLGPELNTAVGWLEGQQFLYDQLDPEGEPVYPDRVAGTIEDLTLIMADGVRLKLTPMRPGFDQPGGRSASSDETQSSPLAEKLVVITGASSGIGRAILINTRSLGSWVAQPYAAAYSASKYGLRGLSEAFAR